MRVLLVEPGKEPVLQEINGSLKSMQEIVGGTIQALYPFEEHVALICNDMRGSCWGFPSTELYGTQRAVFMTWWPGRFSCAERRRRVIPLRA